MGANPSAAEFRVQGDIDEHRAFMTGIAINCFRVSEYAGGVGAAATAGKQPLSL
jgi:hypothetical protein